MTRHRTRRLAAIAIIAGLVAACSSGDDTVELADGTTEASTDDTGGDAVETTVPVDGGDDAGVDTPFADVRLATDTAQQLAPVRIVGLDDATPADGLTAWFSVGDGLSWATRVLFDVDGAYLLAPLFADDPLTGGTLELELSDGVTLGPPMSLTVTPLPAAEGAFAAAVDAQRQQIDDAAQLLGSSWDELAVTAPIALDPLLIGLKLAQLGLDDGTELSAAGEYAAMDAEARAFIDSLVAAIDLPGSFDPARFYADPPAEPPAVQGFRAAPAIATQPTLRGFAAPRGGADCIPSGIEFGENDAGALSAAMIKSAMGAIATDPNGAPGQTFGALELTLGVGGALKGPAGTVFGGLGKVAGVWKTYNNWIAGLYPSSFSAINVELGDTEFAEDHDGPEFWSKVWVVANSTGYTFDGDIAAAIIDGITGGVAGDSIGKDTPDLEVFYKNSTAGQANSTFGDLMPKTSVVSSCPEVWRVNIAGDEWSWARPLLGIFTVDNNALSYENRVDVAKDTLRFAPLPEKFGQRTIRADIGVETHAIGVDVSATPLYVTTPGETVQVTAGIEWAELQTLAWFSGSGTWGDGIGADTNGPTTRPLVTPSDPGAYPVRVEVEATTRQGLLRSDGEPRRYNFVEIELVPIIITPSPAIVPVGETIAFTATDIDGEPIDVLWEATGGDIAGGPSSEATYKAGDDAGQYELTATLATNSDVQAVVPITITDFCLEGTWRIDQEALASIMSGGSGNTIKGGGGDWLLTVQKDGSFVSTLTEFALVVTAAGRDLTIVMNGSQTGRVIATDTDIVGVETTSYSLDARIDTPTGSIPVGASDAPIGTEFGGGPYRCEGGELIVNRDGLDILYVRVD